MQLLYGAVLYEGIGYTDTSDMGDIVIVCHELQYGTAHSSFFDTVFYGDDMLEVESYLVQQGFVERFEKTQVVMGYGDPFVFLCALYATLPMGPRVMTARALPSFSLRPLPTGISSSGHFQSSNTPRPRG